jgi:hypothetical protein
MRTHPGGRVVTFKAGRRPRPAVACCLRIAVEDSPIRAAPCPLGGSPDPRLRRTADCAYRPCLGGPQRPSDRGLSQPGERIAKAIARLHFGPISSKGISESAACHASLFSLWSRNAGIGCYVPNRDAARAGSCIGVCRCSAKARDGL